MVKGRAGELVGNFGKDIPKDVAKERKLGTLSYLGIDIKKEDLQWSDDELSEMGL